MDPTVSVIIPVYNMESYLERCLDSVLNNTYRNLEVICVDDGSTDGSLQILRRYEQTDKRIVVITKENGGVSSARNTGLDHASGNFVSFVDPDDLLHPQHYELMLQAIPSDENTMVICGYQTVEDKDFPLSFDVRSFEPQTLKNLDRAQLFQEHNYRSYCWGRLIPSKMLQGLRFRECLGFSEDSFFIAEIGEQHPGLSCVVIPEALYYYYQRGDSLIRQVSVPNRFLVAEHFTQKVLERDGNDAFYLDNAIKAGLSTRYFAMHIHPDREFARKSGALLKSCLPALRRTDIYSRKKKALYFAFIRVPDLYWLFRIIHEPYMWKWEQVERRKRREARNSKY